MKIYEMGAELLSAAGRATQLKGALGNHRVCVSLPLTQI